MLKGPFENSYSYIEEQNIDVYSFVGFLKNLQHVFLKSHETENFCDNTGISSIISMEKIGKVLDEIPKGTLMEVKMPILHMFSKSSSNDLFFNSTGIINMTFDTKKRFKSENLLVSTDILCYRDFNGNFSFHGNERRQFFTKEYEFSQNISVYLGAGEFHEENRASQIILDKYCEDNPWFRERRKVAGLLVSNKIEGSYPHSFSIIDGGLFRESRDLKNRAATVLTLETPCGNLQLNNPEQMSSRFVLGKIQTAKKPLMVALSHAYPGIIKNSRLEYKNGFNDQNLCTLQIQANFKPTQINSQER